MNRQHGGPLADSTRGILIAGVPLPAAGPGIAQVLDSFRQWTESEISTVTDRVGNARADASGVRSKTGGVKDVVATAKSNLDVLSDNRLDTISSVREEGAGRLREEPARAAGFAGSGGCGSPSPCFEFRAILLQFLDDLPAISNELIGPDLGPALMPRIDFQQQRRAIENAPPFALHPVYRATTIGGNFFESGILDITGRIRTGAQIAMPAQATDEAGLQSCDFTSAHPNLVRAASFAIATSPLALRLSGQTMGTLGETLALGGPKEVGVHGYFKINFHDNRKKKWGRRADAVGELVAKPSVAMDNRLVYCAALAQEANLRSAMERNLFPANRRKLR